jgi:hypothetical protein
MRIPYGGLRFGMSSNRPLHPWRGILIYISNKSDFQLTVGKFINFKALHFGKNINSPSSVVRPFTVAILVIFFLPFISCRKKASVNGRVTNSLTQKPFPGVQITLQESCGCYRGHILGSRHWNTESDENGEYSFQPDTRRDKKYEYDLSVVENDPPDTVSAIASTYLPDYSFNKSGPIEKSKNYYREFRVFPAARVIVVLKKGSQPVARYRVNSFDRTVDTTFITSGSIPADGLFTRSLPVLDSLIFIRIDRTINGVTETRFDTLKARQFELVRYRVTI